MRRAVEKGIRRLDRDDLTRDGMLYFGVDIPQKKLNNAVKCYVKKDISNEAPLLLIDTSLFNSGSKGALITDRHVYALNSGDRKPVNEPISGLSMLRVKKTGVISAALYAKGRKLFAFGHRFDANTMRILGRMLTDMQASSDGKTGGPADIIEIAKKYAGRIHDETIFFHPLIPEGMLEKAKAGFAAGMASDEVPLVFIVEGFGSGRSGCLVTNRNIYAELEDTGGGKMIIRKSIADLRNLSFRVEKALMGLVGLKMIFSGHRRILVFQNPKQESIEAVCQMLGEMADVVSGT